MVKLTCYCGEKTLETTMVGNPPDCVGCSECHSTLASHPSKCKQRQSHEMSHSNGEAVCVRCNFRESSSSPVVEYAMIFKRHDGAWINNKGEEIAEVLQAKYTINGMYRRNGTFEERDDVKSMIVNHVE
jgi:hypothetical protein